METHGRFLNVVDVEATCWSGKQPADQVSEIIEIGLTIVDVHKRVRLAKHQIMVRPERSTVSEFCTGLTGLTQAQVDTGVTFAEACDQLRRQHYADSRPWASWGDYDRKQFLRQCDATTVRYPFSSLHTNAKQQFAQANGWTKGVGMHHALEIAQLPLEGRHHCGADDAWNIAALILQLMTSHTWPEAP
ncbi:Exonuclease RNase T and DNA polymerase III [Catenulispora acidiphila DSM 44928]|uniref:Exonuclease RNase T and DNA polymerase III n=1 Tax=Catenulispora acidiphila (strain DSM 44928 / JCM 14897 / NBRC 102108 / NRRL B-24433 / ID139908) TaxID=479433 RepID=C7QAS2_CATAD|nr:3'-5' exonuclease [Catenulispora acidiphila]ACU74395.1 Exonuclease RNase T and DNA polymerase III [Catenulispora acidiphila DSM 44928]